MLTDDLGLHARYVYTGNRSERYIAERAQGMHSLMKEEMLQRSYKDQRGGMHALSREGPAV